MPIVRLTNDLNVSRIKFSLGLPEAPGLAFLKGNLEDRNPRALMGSANVWTGKDNRFG